MNIHNRNVTNDEEEPAKSSLIKLSFDFSLDPEPAVLPEGGVVPIPFRLRRGVTGLAVTRDA